MNVHNHISQMYINGQWVHAPVEGLDFGIISINDINPTTAVAPFGGMKESGLGREGIAE